MRRLGLCGPSLRLALGRRCRRDSGRRTGLVRRRELRHGGFATSPLNGDIRRRIGRGDDERRGARAGGLRSEADFHRA